jgi:anti-sigma factor RsiW
MNHPTDDELLLLAYDELPASRAAEAEAHLATCSACHGQFAAMARARAATNWARAGTGAGALDPRDRRRSVRLKAAVVGLAAAAVIGAILIGRRANDEPRGIWPKQREWSANAGYFAGGAAVIVIDGQLTQLEQGWSYGRP